MRFNHVALVCSSEENAEEFYQGLLGLKKIKSALLPRELTGRIFGIELECQMLVYGNSGFTAEVFVADTHIRRDACFEHVCLEVKDREAFLDRCESMALEVNRIPKGDSLVVFVKDYDGNLFEIKELTTVTGKP